MAQDAGDRSDKNINLVWIQPMTVGLTWAITGALMVMLSSNNIVKILGFIALVISIPFINRARNLSRALDDEKLHKKQSCDADPGITFQQNNDHEDERY